MAGDDLLEAARGGDAARVRELVRSDPRAAGVPGPSGETPIMAALYHGHHDVANDLADATSSAGIPLGPCAAAALGRLDALELALRTPGAVNGYSYDGWTPLHLAAFFGSAAAVERLIAAGADLAVLSRNPLKNTPLHAAVAGGHQEAALILIERGADVHATDAGGHTPLHIAAEAGYLPVVRALLGRGADPHAVDAEDKTPLSRAAARNHDAIIDLINLER